MKLTSILNSDLIFFGIPGKNRQEIYANMLKKAFEELSLPFSVEEYTQELIEREDSIRIPYENGAALPHIRKPELEDLYIIIGIPETPITLKENDRGPAKFIIMSLISANTSDTYLKALAAFSRYLIKPENVTKLSNCTNSDELLAILDHDEVKLKKSITADDIMDQNCPRIKVDSPLREALDIFKREARSQLPVVDDENRLVGELDATSIIKRSIPNYIMMLDNLKFLTSFEPFEKIFKDEEAMFVKDFISEPRAVIGPETPLIQFTVSLAREEASNIFVIDENHRLMGLVNVQQIIHKVLRG
jgi:mannitol/fructose-specific phosphotransferase system IIA component (Ntr-type)